MKFLVLTVAVLATCSAQTYTTENDDLDIAAVVADNKKLTAFVHCFTDKEDCDPVAAAFKADLPEAVEQACKKCTDAQKHIFKVFLDGLEKKLSGEYKIFKDKYDPQDKYFAALKEAVAKY